MDILPSCLSTLWLLGFLSSAATAECDFSNPIEIHQDGIMLQEFANYGDNTFTMKLTYIGGKAWIGIGFNTQGRASMIPSTVEYTMMAARPSSSMA
jgi:hypothetical protein